MAEVIELDKHRPHTEGPMVCLGCGHKWHGLIRAGFVCAYCPECNLEKGVREGLCLTNFVTACGGCGNTYFAFNDDTGAPFCVVCGEFL